MYNLEVTFKNRASTSLLCETLKKGYSYMRKHEDISFRFTKLNRR